MKCKKYIRCPKCDGKIKINKQEDFSTWNFAYSIRAIPCCVSCGTEYQISINTNDDDFISYDILESI